MVNSDYYCVFFIIINSPVCTWYHGCILLVMKKDKGSTAPESFYDYDYGGCNTHFFN